MSQVKWQKIPNSGATYVYWGERNTHNIRPRYEEQEQEEEKKAEEKEKEQKKMNEWITEEHWMNICIKQGPESSTKDPKWSKVVSIESLRLAEEKHVTYLGVPSLGIHNAERDDVYLNGVSKALAWVSHFSLFKMRLRPDASMAREEPHT